MSRKNEKTSWADKLKAGKEALGGDLPFLLKTELGEWVDIWVKPDTMETDAKNDKGWSCFKIDLSKEDDDGPFEEEEIPFWLKESFIDILELAEPEDEVIALRYKRLKSGNDNYGKWKLGE